MQLCKCVDPAGVTRAGIVTPQGIEVFRDPAITLSQILQSEEPANFARSALREPAEALADFRLLAPIDRQEIWAAGVTYKRSQKARMEESERAATFYDLVYSAPRPELFFKATPHRVVGPDQPIRVRQDTRWSVPEPELTLAISPQMRIVGFTIGNDMSARDIEGENPLYLPQAKLYRQCAGLGPLITLAEAMPPLEETMIQLAIDREGNRCFEGSTKASALNRSFEELVGWLGRDNEFPDGVFLMTGTGIVPPDDFTLAAGDEISISITGIGTLKNRVVIGP